MKTALLLISCWFFFSTLIAQSKSIAQLEQEAQNIQNTKGAQSLYLAKKWLEIANAHLDAKQMDKVESYSNKAQRIVSASKDDELINASKLDSIQLVSLKLLIQQDYDFIRWKVLLLNKEYDSAQQLLEQQHWLSTNQICLDDQKLKMLFQLLQQHEGSASKHYYKNWKRAIDLYETAKDFEQQESLWKQFAEHRKKEFGAEHDYYINVCLGLSYFYKQHKKNARFQSYKKIVEQVWSDAYGSSDSEKYQIVEEMPRFPGCEHIDNNNERKTCSDQLFMEYIYNNLRYPQLARENGIEGMVVVNFEITPRGTIANVKILRDSGAGCGAEVVRLMESMNMNFKRWIPGKQNGKAITVSYNVPVRFKLN